MPATPVSNQLPVIAEEVRSCQKCDLARGRIQAVPGEGNPNARVMLIGEGPGFHEDEQGKPFVGNSGNFLTSLLEKAGLRREDVFITNVVKCRPPSNRDPLPDEMASCSDYLDRQIATIDPEVIVTLGRFSMFRYFPGDRISKIHGQAFTKDRRLVVPMYHPAAALHQGSLRAVIEDDFSKLPKFLADAERVRESEAQRSEVAQQTSLF